MMTLVDSSVSSRQYCTDDTDYHEAEQLAREITEPNLADNEFCLLQTPRGKSKTQFP
jgi:hypothetical protein